MAGLTKSGGGVSAIGQRVTGSASLVSTTAVPLTGPLKLISKDCRPSGPSLLYQVTLKSVVPGSSWIPAVVTPALPISAWTCARVCPLATWSYWAVVAVFALLPELSAGAAVAGIATKTVAAAAAAT